MTRQQLTLTTFPDLHKFTVGFEELFRELQKSAQNIGTDNYPPYNVIRETNDKFLVELAVAGFAEEEISITVENQNLIVSGSKAEKEDETVYVFRGISGRNFTRSWTLADYVEVVEATFENGILRISLERKIPDSHKPKTIAITHKT